MPRLPSDIGVARQIQKAERCQTRRQHDFVDVDVILPYLRLSICRVQPERFDARSERGKGRQFGEPAQQRIPLWKSLRLELDLGSDPIDGVKSDRQPQLS